MIDGLLKDRVAVVTGGDSGIGAACVAALAAAGADVAINFHSDQQKADAACATVTALGQTAIAVQGDVGSEADVDALFDRAAEALGPPDILVNSAGLNMSGVAVADMELAQWEQLIRTDLTGSFLTCRRLVRDLRRAKKPGAIVNITSIHADVMRAGGADYDAAKGGQRNLTQTLALEVAPDGIRVNAVAPGMILTPMNEKAMQDADYRKSLTQSIPMRRAGEPIEIGRMAVLLCSDLCAYMTGATVTIDGGLSLVLGQGA